MKSKNNSMEESKGQNNYTKSKNNSLEDSQQKNQKTPIFVNLVKMKDKNVTVVLTNGCVVYGRLVAYDESLNMTIEKASEWEYGKSVVCLGRCLSMICLGEKSVL
ncbi:hypothetical protein NGRA_1636 [Nosema granulosis]|uniref:Sm domain-containing protein n=1 Tax=Nosema granulosis TaxID=83296 RepID=A0A9P6GY58_9MICR|nr:hypothetical protein NGRA_1636 [Nosema granulosis]